VTLVYCGQTVGWIKMKLRTRVGLVPGHILLNGDPAPPPVKGHRPPIFGPCLLWPNGWMDEDATWYESRPQPRPHCVKCGPSSPRERGIAAPPLFRPMSIVATVAHLSCWWALVLFYFNMKPCLKLNKNVLAATTILFHFISFRRGSMLK